MFIAVIYLQNSGNTPIPIHGEDALGNRVKDYVPFLAVHIISMLPLNELLFKQ